MFKKPSNLDQKRALQFIHSAGSEKRSFFKSKWFILLLVFGTGAFSVFFTRLLYRSRLRRLTRRGNILVEPSISTSDEEANFHVRKQGLHASHSAPNLASLIPSTHDGIWDVVIVGGGPAGSTAAYYLAKQQISVLVLEKDIFPRDKICGDQIQPQVQFLLNDMGILQSLLDEDVIKWSTHRGIVSPSGISFIGELKETGSLISVQRIVLDKKIAEAAIRAGASVRENVTVKSAHLNRTSRRVSPTHAEASSSFSSSERDKGDYWTIQVVSSSERYFQQNSSAQLSSIHPSHSHHTTQQNNGETTILARLLVCADGANSTIARSLTGLSPEDSPSLHLGPPNAIGCRAFAKHRTHMCRADEVTFYSRDMLPGSFRISSELEDFLNLTCFVLPSDDYSTSQLPLHALHQFNHALENEPWIQATLGPRCELTPVRSAPMRVGGIAKTYFPHGLIVGDAAGQQDPLSGDGLQYGMQAAKMAADVLAQALREANYSAASMQRYEKKWKAAFGWDFFWARQIVYLMARFPILVDAVALVIQRHGMKSLAFWALAKSGMKSKWELILWFLRPDVAWLVAWHSLTLWLRTFGLF